MIIDYSEAGRTIGLELTAPSAVTLAGMNEIFRIFRRLGQPAIQARDLAPLVAA